MESVFQKQKRLFGKRKGTRENGAGTERDKWTNKNEGMILDVCMHDNDTKKVTSLLAKLKVISKKNN